MVKNAAAAVGHKSNFVTKNAISECTGINGSILPSEQSGLYCETMFAAAVDRYWDGWTKTALGPVLLEERLKAASSLNVSNHRYILE